MHLRRSYLLVGGLLLAIATLVTLFHYIAPGSAPWTPSGTLVVAVRNVVYEKTDLSLNLGLDNFMLLTQDGTQVPASLRTRRVAFDQDHTGNTILLNTSVPAGSYTGLRFLLTSPELKNPWQGDTPPAQVVLGESNLLLPSSFVVHEGETTVMILGFETISALHESKEGYTYLPVIQLETRSGAVITQAKHNATSITGGTILNSATYGMDWDGQMRLNYRARNPSRASEPR